MKFRASVLSTILVLSVVAPGPASAAPEGGEVRAGSAVIETSPGVTTVRQASDRAILEWRRFSLDPDELVRFLQPSDMAVILNRVVGQDPSRILGRLQANGQVFLVNPNGILFGPGSRVDVAGLLVSTLSVSDQDFMAGAYQFSQEPGRPLAAVVNQGDLSISDRGYLVLAAPLVSNEGLIVARQGAISLASGQSFTLNLDGRELVNFQLAEPVSEGGTVFLTAEAAGGVLSSVVQSAELVSAESLVTQDGVVRLEGGEGLLLQAGTLQAAGGRVSLDANQVTLLAEESLTSTAGEVGGQVTVMGRDVRLDGVVDASGLQGGGTVRVGDPRLTETTTVRGLVLAEALEGGPGGEIVVWAEDATRMEGALRTTSADPGAGGFIEVSSHDTIVLTGSLAPGEGGAVLIDPVNLTIVSGTPGTNEIQNTTIEGVLNSGSDFTLQANQAGSEFGDIRQNADAFILKSAGGPATLTFDAGDADGWITLLGGISSLQGPLSLVLEAGSVTGRVATSSTLSTNGGDLVSTAAGSFSNTGQINTTGGNVSVTQHASVSAGRIDAGGGNIEISTSGTISNLDGISGNQVDLSAGLSIYEIGDADIDITASSLTMVAGFDIGDPANQPMELFVFGSITATVTGTGSIRLTNGPAAAFSATTANGSIDAYFGGDLDAVSVIAGGAGQHVSLEAYGDINVGYVEAAEDSVTLIASSAIGQGTVDGAADLVAGDLTLTAATGIGEGPGLEVEAEVLSASVTGTGGLQVSDLAGGLSVTSAQTSAGDISLSATGGDLGLVDVRAGGTASDLDVATLGSGDVLVVRAEAVGGSLTVSAADDLSDTGPTDPEAELIGASLLLSANGSIGIGVPLEIAAGQLTAESTGTGSIRLVDLDSGLIVEQASTADGSVVLGSDAGGLTARSVVANGLGRSVEINVAGDLLVGSVVAQGDAISLTAGGAILEEGADTAPDISGESVGFTAGTGIGTGNTLELSVGNMSATVSGVGGIHVRDTGGGLIVDSAVTADGSIGLVASSGSLRLTFVEANGPTRDVRATTGLGNLLVGDVSAAGDAIYLDANGQIHELGSDPAADLATGTLVLTSTGSAGAGNPLEINANFVEAALSGPGDLELIDTIGGLAVTSASTADGSMTMVVHDGTLSLTALTAGGSNGDISASTEGFGNVRVGSVTALANMVTLTSADSIIELGSDGFEDVTANTLQATALSGLGTGNPLEVAISNLTAEVTGPGSLDLHDTGGFTATSVTTTDGSITLVASGGNLGLGSVTANGLAADLSATTQGAGNINVNRAFAVGDTVTLTAAGSILETGADAASDLNAAALSLSAASGIGSSANPLEISAARFTAVVSGTGDIGLADLSGGVTATSASTFDGAIAVSAADGNLTLTDVRAGGTDRDLTATTTGSGDVRVAFASAVGDTIALTSAGRILESLPDSETDLVTGILSLSSARSIGGSDAIEIKSVKLDALVSGNGGIRLRDTAGGLNATSVAVQNGDLALSTVNGNLTATNLTASGQATLATIGTGDILVDSVSAGGAVVLQAAGSVAEVGNDLGADLLAGGDSEIRANGGAISPVNALEVGVTNGSLSVLATGQTAGVSVRIDGTVSPTGTLIRLSSPPGSVLFNGSPVP